MSFYLLTNEVSLLAFIGAIVLIVGGLAVLKNMRNLLLVLIISSIAEVGYVLIGLGIGTFEGVTGGLLHIEYQLVMRIMVFIAALALISKVGSSEISKLKGIGKLMPMTATVFGFGIFAIMGLSPFKGSISKFLIIYSAVENGDYLFAIIGILGSIIEAIYFIYIIQQICFEKTDKVKHDLNHRNSFVLNFSMAVFVGLTISMSLFPHGIIHFTEQTALSFFNLKEVVTLPEFEKPWPNMVLIPYLAAFAIYFIGKYSENLRNLLAIVTSLVTFYLVYQSSSYDDFSKIFAVIMTFIGLIITIYSVGYFKGKVYSNRYFFFLFLMQGTLIGVVTSTDFASLYLFWELMTWTSYLLVIHEQTQKALKAGFKYFIMCTSGAYLMLLALLILHAEFGSFEYSIISEQLHLLTPTLLFALVIMFIIGFGVKAGLVPMHSWLPDAHPVAPSSISAPMSGILTKVGIYGLILVVSIVFGKDLIRTLGVTENYANIALFVSLLGALTLLFGEFMALVQKDIKRMLAYSTMAQIGEIVITLGIGTYLSMIGSLYHVLNHSIMKNLLFLAVGALIYRLKSQEIEKFKGIGTQMPITSLFFGIGILAIMGLPPFNGFISKYLMLYASVEAGHIELAVLILFGSVIGGFYYVKLLRIIFFEKYEGPKLKEAPITMLIPLGILTSLIIVNGLYPQLALTLVKAAADYIAFEGSLTITQIPVITVSWPLLLIVPTIGALATFILGKKSAKIAGLIAVLTMVLTLIIIAMDFEKYDIFSASFAFLIAFVGVLNFIYTVGYMDHHGHAQNRFYMFFLLMIVGLLGVSISESLFSFFFFWEIMSSWTLYFVIIHEQTQKSLKEGFKYFSFNYIGASLMFLGIVIVSAKTGVTEFSLLANALESLSLFDLSLSIGLILAGLLMKAAMLPLRIDYQMHPEAAPTPVSGYISAVLLKSAPFGMAKLFFLFGGIAIFNKIGQVFDTSTLMYISAWIATLTILIGAIMALMQNSIKLVLIYSTVSQLGYILLGISLGTTLGVTGGLLHFVNHMFFKDLLFLAAGVIMVQTGVKSLEQIGGLGKKMPYTLATFGIGALAAAGVPPFNGFTSKWIIYQAAMEKGEVFIAFISLAASVLTLAYLMKFLHSAFFGHVPKEFENVKEAPFIMLLPMLVLAGLCILFGVFPGLLLEFISKIEIFFGLEPIVYNLFGVETSLGSWHSGVVAILIFIALLLGSSVYIIGNRKIRYTDLHTCGNLDLTTKELHVSSSHLYAYPIKLTKMAIYSLKQVVSLGRGA